MGRRWGCPSGDAIFLLVSCLSPILLIWLLGLNFAFSGVSSTGPSSHLVAVTMTTGWMGISLQSGEATLRDSHGQVIARGVLLDTPINIPAYSSAVLRVQVSLSEPLQQLTQRYPRSEVLHLEASVTYYVNWVIQGTATYTRDFTVEQGMYFLTLYSQGF